MKLYCSQCNEYIHTVGNTSATVRCIVCGKKLIGRKQREVWKELNNERQGRLDAVEDAMNERRPLRNQRELFDD